MLRFGYFGYGKTSELLEAYNAHLRIERHQRPKPMRPKFHSKIQMLELLGAKSNTRKINDREF